MKKMLFIFKVVLALCLIFVVGSYSSPENKRNSCHSCGVECLSACETRQFKTCCFNYMRKRSGITGNGILPSTNNNPINDNSDNDLFVSPMDLGRSLRLELWLAKSRNSPLFDQQRYYDAAEDNSGGDQRYRPTQ